MLTGSERLGRVKGKQEMLLEQMQAKFRKVPARLRKRIQTIYDPNVLTDLGLRLLTTDTLSDFEALLPNPSPTKN
jgi:hypothetical protein